MCKTVRYSLLFVLVIGVALIFCSFTSTFAHADPTPNIDQVMADNGSSNPAYFPTTASNGELEIRGEGFMSTLNSASVSDVVSSATHTCALVQQSVYCWGDNTYGQLGDFTFANALTPVQTAPVNPILGSTAPFSELVVSDSRTCAISGSDIYCWGLQDDGRIYAKPTLMQDRYTSAVMSGVGYSLRNLSINDDVVCANLSLYDESNDLYGQVMCFGDRFNPILNGANGQGVLLQHLEDGESGEYLTVNDVKVGSKHACAIFMDSLNETFTRCWGNNYFGQLGIGGKDDNESVVHTFEEVDFSSVQLINPATPLNAVTLSVSQSTTCAQFEDLEVVCFGGIGDGIRDNAIEEPLGVLEFHTQPVTPADSSEYVAYFDTTSGGERRGIKGMSWRDGKFCTVVSTALNSGVDDPQFIDVSDRVLCRDTLTGSPELIEDSTADFLGDGYSSSNAWKTTNITVGAGFICSIAGPDDPNDEVNSNKSVFCWGNYGSEQYLGYDSSGFDPTAHEALIAKAHKVSINIKDNSAAKVVLRPIEESTDAGDIGCPVQVFYDNYISCNISLPAELEIQSGVFNVFIGEGSSSLQYASAVKYVDDSFTIKALNDISEVISPLTFDYGDNVNLNIVKDVEHSGEDIIELSDCEVISGYLPGGISLKSDCQVEGILSEVGKFTFEVQARSTLFSTFSAPLIISINVLAGPFDDSDDEYYVERSENKSLFLNSSGFGEMRWTALDAPGGNELDAGRPSEELWEFHEIDLGMQYAGVNDVKLYSIGNFELNFSQVGDYVFYLRLYGADCEMSCVEYGSIDKTITFHVVDAPILEPLLFGDAFVGHDFFRTVQSVSNAHRPYRIFASSSVLNPITFSVSGGNLPPGLRLDTSGQVVADAPGIAIGAPTSPGVYTFEVTANNYLSACDTQAPGDQPCGGASTPREYTIDVFDSVTNARNISLPAIKLHKPYSQPISIPHVKTQPQFEVVDGSNCGISENSLPAGLYLSSSGVVTGALEDELIDMDTSFCARVFDETPEDQAYIELELPVDSAPEFDEVSLQAMDTDLRVDSGEEVVNTFKVYGKANNVQVYTPGSTCQNAVIEAGSQGEFYLRIIPTSMEGTCDIQISADAILSSVIEFYLIINTKIVTTAYLMAYPGQAVSGAINAINADSITARKAIDCEMPFPYWLNFAQNHNGDDITLSYYSASAPPASLWCFSVLAKNALTNTFDTKTFYLQTSFIPNLIKFSEYPLLVPDRAFETVLESITGNIKRAPYAYEQISSSTIQFFDQNEHIVGETTNLDAIGLQIVGDRISGETEISDLVSLNAGAAVYIRIALRIEDADGAVGYDYIDIRIISHPTDFIFQRDVGYQDIGTFDNKYEFTLGENVIDENNVGTGELPQVFVNPDYMRITYFEKAEDQMGCTNNDWLTVYSDGGLWGYPDASGNGCLRIKYRNDAHEGFETIHFNVKNIPRIYENDHVMPTASMTVFAYDEGGELTYSIRSRENSAAGATWWMEESTCEEYTSDLYPYNMCTFPEATANSEYTTGTMPLQTAKSDSAGGEAGVDVGCAQDLIIGYIADDCAVGAVRFKPVGAGTYSFDLHYDVSGESYVDTIQLTIYQTPVIDAQCSLVPVAVRNASGFHCNQSALREFQNAFAGSDFHEEVFLDGTPNVNARIVSCEYSEDGIVFEPVAGFVSYDIYDPDFTFDHPDLGINWEPSCAGVTWMKFANRVTGHIPDVIDSGFYHFGVRADNDYGTTFVNFTLRILTPPHILNNAQNRFPNTMSDSFYAYNIGVEGTNPISLAVSSGNLPNGIFFCGDQDYQENPVLEDGVLVQRYPEDSDNTYILCQSSQAGVQAFLTKLQQTGSSAGYSRFTTECTTGEDSERPCIQSGTNVLRLKDCQTMTSYSMDMPCSTSGDTMSGIMMPCTFAPSELYAEDTVFGQWNLLNSSRGVLRRDVLNCKGFSLFGISNTLGTFRISLSARNEIGVDEQYNIPISVVATPEITTASDLGIYSHSDTFGARPAQTQNHIPFTATSADVKWHYDPNSQSLPSTAPGNLARCTSSNPIAYGGLPYGFAFSDATGHRFELDDAGVVITSGGVINSSLGWDFDGDGFVLSSANGTQNPGIYCFTLSASSEFGVLSKMFTISLAGPPFIGTESIPDAVVGKPYSGTKFDTTVTDGYGECYAGIDLADAGDSANAEGVHEIPDGYKCFRVNLNATSVLANDVFTYTLLKPLPPGLSLSQSGGAITGIPTAQGDYMIEIKVSGFGGTATFLATIEVRGAPVIGKVYDKNLPHCQEYVTSPDFNFASCVRNSTPAFPSSILIENPYTNNSLKSFALPGDVATNYTDNITWRALPMEDSVTLGPGIEPPVNARPGYTGMPSGLQIDSDTGVIFGTPSLDDVGHYKFAVVATNNFTVAGLSIGDGVPYIIEFDVLGRPKVKTSPEEVVNGIAQNDYTQQFEAYALPAVSSWNFCTPSLLPEGVSITGTDADLPPGLRLGYTFGTPYSQLTGVINQSANGTYYFGLRAINALGASDCVAYSIVVKNKPLFLQESYTGDALTYEDYSPDVKAASSDVVQYTKVEYSQVQSAFSAHGTDEQGNAIPPFIDASYYRDPQMPSRTQESVINTITQLGIRCQTTPWLSISESGEVSGFPENRAPNNYKYCFVVIAKNDVGFNYQLFYFDAYANPEIYRVDAYDWAQNSPDFRAQVFAREKVDYSDAYTATPGDITYSSGDITAGLVLNTQTGEITGTPSQLGENSFWVGAHNAYGSVFEEVRFNVSGAPVILQQSLPDAPLGVTYDLVLQGHIQSQSDDCVSGKTCVIKYNNATSELPNGIQFSESSGQFLGTPEYDDGLTATDYPKSYAINLKIYQLEGCNFEEVLEDATCLASNPSREYNYILQLTAPPPVILLSDTQAPVPSGLPHILEDGATNINYENSLYAQGASPIVWQVSGTFPFGLSWSVDVNNSRHFVMSGVPDVVGTYSFKVTATNFAGSATREFNITVYGTPKIDAASLSLRASLGENYDYMLQASGMRPMSFDIVDNDGNSISTIANAEDLCLDESEESSFDNSRGNIVTADGLPRCFAFDKSSGQIVGRSNRFVTPNKEPDEIDAANWLLEGIGDSNMYKFNISAKNHVGVDVQQISLEITGSPKLSFSDLVPAVVNEDYEAYLDAFGLNPVRWQIATADLDALGLGYICDLGKVYGVPRHEGEYVLNVLVRNDGSACQDIAPSVENYAPNAVLGSERAHNVTPFEDFDILSIWDCGVQVCEATGQVKLNVYTKPQIVPEIFRAKVGVYFKRIFQATGTKPIEYFPKVEERCGAGVNPFDCKFTDPRIINASLPKGMWFTKSGTIEGTPEVAGTFEFQLVARNLVAEVVHNYTLKVLPDDDYSFSDGFNRIDGNSEYITSDGGDRESAEKDLAELNNDDLKYTAKDNRNLESGTSISRVNWIWLILLLGLVSMMVITFFADALKKRGERDALGAATLGCCAQKVTTPRVILSDELVTSRDTEV
ncbi:MAG: putative Ig domain-containing protein [Candidatus Ancillula sp.]|jgi:hypothetical protein|nr:putative Ig domain-containing protein [Candidatus Ancillula sp.]